MVRTCFKMCSQSQYPVARFPPCKFLLAIQFALINSWWPLLDGLYAGDARGFDTKRSMFVSVPATVC